MSWSAPGKVFLFGEYAVLRGAPAIVTAVDRRVIAERTGDDRYTVIGATADPELPAAVAMKTGGLPAGLTVDVSQFVSGEEKIGLGSSAASAVVLTAAMLDSVDVDDVYPDAYHAHRVFQHGLGSGADVAASAYGGTIVARPDFEGGPPIVERLEWPDELTVYCVWTGRSANTRQFVDAVESTQRPMPHLAQLAEAAVVAFREGDVDRLLVIATDYDDAMGQLGVACGVAIRTRQQAKISRIAREFGATSKPSGAGGGDISLVFARAGLDAATLAAALPKRTRLLDLKLGAPGVSRS